MHEGIGISGSVKTSDIAAAVSAKLPSRASTNAGASNGTSEKQIAIGNEALMRELGVPVLDDQVLKWLQREATLQRTGLLVAYGGALVACLSVEDPIKPEAGGVMARLQQMGVRSSPMRLFPLLSCLQVLD
jgi:cation transport ATPase